MTRRAVEAILERLSYQEMQAIKRHSEVMQAFETTQRALIKILDRLDRGRPAGNGRGGELPEENDED